MFWRKKKASPPVADPVYVVTFGGQPVPFNDREHAGLAMAEWSATYPTQDEFWAATGPVIQERRQNPPAWSRVPRKEFVYHRATAFLADGKEHTLVTPLAAGSMWVFEFMEGHTEMPSRGRVEVRPGRGVYVEAGARGTDPEAVEVAFGHARKEAQATARRLSAVNS